MITLKFSAHGLESHGCWYKFHTYKPMFYLSRVMENGGNQKVYASEYVKSLNPS
jgi:hypothetical protein